MLKERQVSNLWARRLSVQGEAGGWVDKQAEKIEEETKMNLTVIDNHNLGSRNKRPAAASNKLFNKHKRVRMRWPILEVWWKSNNKKYIKNKQEINSLEKNCYVLGCEVEETGLCRRGLAVVNRLTCLWSVLCSHSWCRPANPAEGQLAYGRLHQVRPAFTHMSHNHRAKQPTTTSPHQNALSPFINIMDGFFKSNYVIR